MVNLPANLAAELEALLPPGGLLLDAAERLAYGYDNSRRQGLPLAVALPTDAAQVQAIVRLCREHRLPIVARGRGTNTTGASVPGEDALVVSFERMNRVLAIRPGDRVAVVEPGLLNGELQAALAPHGLFWPPDPTSAGFCSIGGNLACNAGGPRAVKYGATRDNVLALKAVTGTGERVEFGARTSKNAAGFDLSRLLIGSEGGLALVVEATLKLSPKPAARRMLRALYRDMESAAEAVARLMAQPDTPSMLEFMDATALKLAREVGGADIPDAGALLMIEGDGDPAQLPELMRRLAGHAQGEGCLDATIPGSEAEQERLMAARKALSPALRSLASGKINEDVVVPVSHVPALVRFVETLARESHLTIVSFGHIGNGNVHVNVMYDKADAGQTATAEACAEKLFAEVLRLGGTLSGEHGIGLSKRDFMARAYDPATLAAMRAVKRALDPDGILNPGKLLPDT